MFFIDSPRGKRAAEVEIGSTVLLCLDI